MNKALLISAAVSMAFSGAAAAGGMKFGASADQYIDSSTQISANDCHSLSVESARSACLSAQGSSDAAIGATSGSAGGTAQGGTPSGSNESKPGESSSAGATAGTTGKMKSGEKAQGSTKAGAKSQGSYKSQGKKQGNPAGSNESKPGESSASGVR